jgi:hypothetical protein
MADKVTGWQDTLLTDEQIGVTYRDTSHLPPNLLVNVILLSRTLNKAQAKATWEARQKEVEVAYKAGRQEVVDWVETHSPWFIAGRDIATEGANEMKQHCSYFPVIRWLDWQAQKKEWGIV